MNLARQSPPVIRGASREPINPLVEGANWTGDCLRWCAANCERNYVGCEMLCHAGQGPRCP